MVSLATLLMLSLVVQKKGAGECWCLMEIEFFVSEILLHVVENWKVVWVPDLL
jgi:hypothetical protein